jgi:hypothetical protein
MTRAVVASQTGLIAKHNVSRKMMRSVRRICDGSEKFENEQSDKKHLVSTKLKPKSSTTKSRNGRARKQLRKNEKQPRKKRSRPSSERRTATAAEPLEVYPLMSPA